LRAQSLRISALLRELELELGDRVATLAWNTQAHVETWYAIMGMGAICHTLNPRLTVAHIASMLTQPECRVLIVSADLATLAQQILEQVPALLHVLIIDGPEERWQRSSERPVVLELDSSMARARADVWVCQYRRAGA
jgi:fatty-acyl-CoA synthase